jgi:hypothetical protein
MHSVPRSFRSDNRPSLRVVAIVFPSGESARPSVTVSGAPGISRIGGGLLGWIVAQERNPADDRQHDEHRESTGRHGNPGKSLAHPRRFKVGLAVYRARRALRPQRAIDRPSSHGSPRIWEDLQFD